MGGDMIDHQEIEARHRKVMNALASVIDEAVSGYGFCLLVFPFVDEKGRMNGRMNYISNAQRSDMLVALKEFIAHNEGRAVEAPKMKQ
jgi:hypothetical protein